MCTKQEQSLHINALDLSGAELVLPSFFKDNKSTKHIRAMTEDNTAVAYINNVGGIRSDVCDDVAFEICQWAAKRQLWISAPQIPVSENVTADKNSVLRMETCGGRVQTDC